MSAGAAARHTCVCTDADEANCAPVCRAIPVFRSLFSGTPPFGMPHVNPTIETWGTDDDGRAPYTLSNATLQSSGYVGCGNFVRHPHRVRFLICPHTRSADAQCLLSLLRVRAPVARKANSYTKKDLPDEQWHRQRVRIARLLR